MHEWWGEIDEQVLTCLSRSGPMSPNELGKRLGVSESTAVSLICLLAQDGRVAIRLVERHPDAVARNSRIA
jgi:DNA-binding MarR family transcriptional regulator